MQNQNILDLPDSVLQERYQASKNQLKSTLESVFDKYRCTLTGEKGQKLVDVIHRGENMLEEIDFLCFPPWIVDSSPDKKNYHTCHIIYTKFNDILQSLLVDPIDEEDLQQKLNGIKNDMRRYNIPASFCERALAAICAFSNALFALAGTLLVTVAICPLCITDLQMGLGTALAYSVLGLFATVTSGGTAVHRTKVAMDRQYKYTKEFEDSLTDLTSTFIMR